jgi:parallel beta-helix repeat protein
MVSGLGAKRRGKRNSVGAGWRPASQGHLAEALEGRVLLATVYVDCNPAITTHDGQSWDTAYADLQPVLTAAVSGTTIKVADGTYKPTSGTDRTVSFELKNGVGLYGGFAGFGAPDPDARDVVAYPTILSGDIGIVGDTYDNSYHVVFSGGADGTAILDGFTVCGGRADGSGSRCYGGGMFNSSSSPTLANCTFSGNTATWGGGMYNDSFSPTPSSPTVTNCTFSGNSGTGMYNFSSSPTLISCTFSGNSGRGGMYNDRSSPTLTNCTFIRNTASPGGGMYNHQSSPTLTCCTFIGNTGGGIYNDASSPTLTNCIMWGNGSTPISNSSGSTPTVTYSDIEGGYIGTGNINADPLFVRSPWAGPDGLWGTDDDDCSGLSLRSGSPCLDVGSNAAVPAGVTTDIAGNPRIQNGTVDIGAYEGPVAVSPKLIYVDIDAAGASTGTDWANAFTSLQSAILAATDGDTIRIAEGAYKPTDTTDRTMSFALRNAVAIYGGYAGCGAPDPDVRDLVALPTILSGDIGVSGNMSDNSYHVVTAVAVSSSCVLDAVTVTLGNANGSGAWQDFGGGMYNDRSSPTLTSCTFSGNAGRGIYNSFSSPTLANCTFTGNTATSGGGIYNSSSSPTLANCTFTGNTAVRFGAGMYNTESSPTLTNCTFTGNTATSGGGMYNVLSSSTLANCTFTGNTATSGGGMYNSLSSPTLANCTFTGNTTTSGGGMYNFGSSSPTLTNCIVWGIGSTPIKNSSGIPTITYSDIEGGYAGSRNFNADPLFVRNPSPGADGKWGTVDDDYGDLRLQLTSPCIDAGKNAAVPAGLTTDLAGMPRFLDVPTKADTGSGTAPIVDMGAYETVPLLVTAQPDLLATCDTGLSDSDNLTNFNNASPAKAPRFAITGVIAGAMVELFADGVLVASGIASGNTMTLILDGTSKLADGSHVIIARQSVSGVGTTPDSPPLTVNISTVAPNLAASSDSGMIDSDRLTFFNGSLDKPLIFTFPDTAAGAIVTMYANGVLLGSGVSDGGEVTVWSDGSNPLADGTYLITARQQLPGQPQTLDSDFLTMTVDTTAPAVAAPDLQSASDTGISNTDNITSDNTPTFDIAAPYYGLYRNGVLVAGPYAGGPYTSPPLADGTYLFSALAVDVAGNMAAPSPWLAVTIDTKSPAAPVAPDLQAASDSGISDTDDITNVKTPVFTVAGVPYFRFSRNGTQISGNYESGTSYTTTAQSDGTYTVVAVDAAGNVSAPSATLSVTIDTVAPGKPGAPDLQSASDSGRSSTDNNTNLTTPTFTVAAAPYFRFFRNGVQISGNYETGSLYTTPVQTDGTYTYTVAAVDAAGNVSTASSSLSVTIDTVAPAAPSAPDLQATSDSGISNTDSLTSAKNLVFSLTGGTPYFRFYRGDTRLSGSYATGSTYTATSQPDGTWSYGLSAIDVAGNESAQSLLSVTIDTAAPSSQVAPLPPASSTDSFNVNWAGQDNAGGSGIANYDVYVSDNGAAPALWLDQTTATSATYTGWFGHNYGFFSVARDIAGNVEALFASPDTQTTILSTWNGTPGDDQFALRVDPAGSLVEFYTTALIPGAVPAFVVPLSIMIPFTINGQGGNDTLTFDFTYGNPVPPGSLTLDAAGGTFSLNILGSPGNDTITLTNTQLTCNSAILPLAAVQSVALDTSAGDDTITLDGSFALPYTLQFGTGADTLNIQGGIRAFPADLGSGADVALNLSASAKVTFSSTQHLRSLGLGPSTSAAFAPGLPAALFAKGLTIGGSGVSLGKLDLADSDLVLGYSGSSPYETIRPWLLAGMVAGRGIFSSTGSVSSPTVLGLADNAMIRQTTWNGRTVSDGVNFKQLLTKRTLFGDANLDGRVDEHDELTILTNMGRVGATYFEGDVNYGGAVTLDDLAIVQANLGAGMAMTGTNLLIAPVAPSASFKSVAAPSTAAKSTPAASAKSVANKVVKLAKAKVQKPKLAKKARRS